MNAEGPIGVFDTGVGGLSTVRELCKTLPGEQILYFADRARQPYGALPRNLAETLVLESLAFLLDRGAKALVIACNTASAAGYEAAKQRFPVPVFSVIGPGMAEACRMTRNKKIGLIGTKITVESGVHEAICATLDPNVRVFGQACPLLPPLIELGKHADEETRKVIGACLRPLQEKGIDTLILGCTHFPFVRDLLQEALGGEINLIDPNGELVRELRDALGNRNALRKGIVPLNAHRFIVSRYPETFRRVGSMLLGWSLPTVEEIPVGKPVEGVDIPERDLYDPAKSPPGGEWLASAERLPARGGNSEG